MQIVSENAQEGVLINPSRAEYLRMLRMNPDSFDCARMSLDAAGNLYVWPANGGLLHSDVSQHIDDKTDPKNDLTSLSLYGFKDGIAVRLYDIGDGEEHPKCTQLARRVPSIVRVWGPNVVCTDMHGEP